MSGSNASALTPLAVGTVDSGDFDSWLGKEIQIGNECYTMVQCGIAIASNSNGKQLVTALSSGIASFVVSLATGLGTHLCCGAIPSTLTVPIASNSFFLAVRDSPGHTMLVLGSLTGSATTTGGVYVGALLMTNTGNTLTDVFTGGATSASVTGTTLDVQNAANNCGQALQIQTGTVATQMLVRYRAPFRGG